MSDIFISYSSEDKGRVQALARALERKGWSVWWDRRIPVGRSYAEVIEEALDATKAVVVVWTSTSVKSQWVKNEALEGLNRRALFPVMLEAVKIPLEFRHVQAARLMDWQPEQDHAVFDQFIDDLAGVIGTSVTQSQGTPASPAKPTPEPETGLLQGRVRAVHISGNNNLSALTLSPGTLEPAFAAITTDYTVNVASDVSSVTLSATKSDPDAVLSGVMTSGSGTATSQATIPLNGPGTVTPAVFTIAAPNGSSKTYRIMVNRAVLSGNNNLSVLTISPGALSPAFRPGTHGYAVEVASNVGSVMVTPRLQDANAMMTVDGQTTNSGEARTIALRGPGSNTLINIVVTAPNGAQKTYAVKIYRAAEVETAPERRDATSVSDMGDSRHPDSSRETVTSQRTTEFSGDDRESVRSSEDRTSQSTGAGQSTASLPYLPIGLGILAAMGALAYFVVFSQGPSPGTRDESRYQPPVQSPTTTIAGKDGAPMVLVLAGEFMMGDDRSGQNDERPAHSVYLDAFYIDQYEVTTARYARHFEQTNRAAPQYWATQVLLNHGNKPVVGVDWNDAVAYCSWAGKRLPTEAEWEKAARGTDQRVYPWGNEAPNEQRGNFNHCCDFKDYVALTNVGSFEKGKSPYGVYDMAGNVWEWVADWYDANHYSKSPKQNPRGPSSGEYRVLRGGSWDNEPVDVRSAYRHWVTPTLRYAAFGFRCAQDVPK